MYSGIPGRTLVDVRYGEDQITLRFAQARASRIDFGCDEHRGSPTSDAKLGENARNVVHGCAQTDRKQFGNFVIGCTPRKQVQDLNLTCGQVKGVRDSGQYEPYGILTSDLADRVGDVVNEPSIHAPHPCDLHFYGTLAGDIGSVGGAQAPG
jgi:hypothetical protein